MSNAIYTETVIFRTTPEMVDWIKAEKDALQIKFGEGFRFADGDVVRRALYKQMRAEK